MAAELHRLGVFNQNLRDDAFDFSFDFIHHFHCFDDAYDGIRVNFGANFNVNSQLQEMARDKKCRSLAILPQFRLWWEPMVLPNWCRGYCDRWQNRNRTRICEFIILNDRCAAIGAALEPYF